MNFQVWIAAAELLLAAALWGFGFIATVWGLRELDPFELTFIRFALATLLLSPVLLLPRWRQEVVRYLKISFWPGVFFALLLIVQTWGLQYTTATKSGFLTTLYVVFVPILESSLSRQKLSGALWLTVGLAFLGTLMIVNLSFSNFLQDMNKGDLLTVLCALLATGQIYAIGLVSSGVGNALAFNFCQTFWAAMVSAPIALNHGLFLKLMHFSEWLPTAQAGLLSLVVGSTIIAFTLQVRAQAYLSPTVSSLLFLLESPFALMFAFFLLGERLGPVEAMGAVLIFSAAILANWIEARRRRQLKNSR